MQSPLVEDRAPIFSDRRRDCMGSMLWTDPRRGFFVSFGYTKDAERECAAFHKRTGKIIKLLTVQEILDEEHVQKM